MATAYQPTPRWEQSVPMGHENLPLANQALFDPSYAFDPSQTPRDSSNYTPRRPSQHAATLDVDTYQLDQIKRDSGRSVRKGSSASRGSSPQKATMSHIRRPSTSHSRPSAPIAIPRAESVPTIDPDPERSAWIHRDKLARIESQEMAAAGFGMPRTTQRRQSRSDSRSASRSASRNPNARGQSTDRHTNQLAFTEDAATPRVPKFEEQSGEGANQDQDSDDYEERLQEEPRMDRSMYGRSLPRSAMSRIPVARASPAPVSQSVVERDSPLPRSMSSPLGDSASSRTRSRSLGNPAMMAEPSSTRSAIPSKPRPRSSHMQDSPSATDSPSLSQRTTQSLTAVSRAKAMNKAATGSVGRKTVPRTTSKARNPSNSPKDSPARRPTSGSTRSRPTSIHNRPEGEAPWIATMYKPDPMLPPDQQILPTHAKRTMQGGSDDEKEKSFPVNIDSLSDEELARMGALPPPGSNKQPDTTPSIQQAQNPTQPPWPLASTKSDAKSQTGSARAPNGGYTITPRIAPPIAPPKSPKPQTNQSEATRPTNPAVQRVPDLDEKEDGKKKKKLACCVVM
ncbi:hypothetical protein M438DRAFT_317553 [Aureobasidium pullulans EXF-150]|uniref:Uncharacterized protein n=1 Tax=Aureobasidium pullulans EXF-150 TaxID=1043002 RepID=A0A074XM16_AURPU|nr:uncharacterized protein M438DRAFT_317553 [Aureobasidium pullulans EXF-150]KEQ84744.1 hypothetical protein M438DRAFT_317553 [Aureobasidium pullulans EXF-150]